MLLQRLRALCFAPGRPWSIWNYLGAPARSTGVSGRFGCGFRTDLHFADVCGVKDERAWDLFCGIIFLDPVTTRHFSQFRLMWPHRRSRSLPFHKWWAAIRSYMGQMFHKTRDQMNNWRWDNPRAFTDQVNHANPQTTSLGKVKRTGC
jgi:hypothetical protein